MNKEDLNKTIAKFLKDNPSISLDNLIKDVTKAYHNASHMQISEYQPINIKRSSNKSSGYEAKVTKVESKGLQDASLSDDY